MLGTRKVYPTLSAFVGMFDMLKDVALIALL
jgi:hypothetical protein